MAAATSVPPEGTSVWTYALIAANDVESGQRRTLAPHARPWRPLQMRTTLRELAANQEAVIEADGGIHRAWLRLAWHDATRRRALPGCGAGRPT